jgi:hypothetical protein
VDRAFDAAEDRLDVDAGGFPGAVVDAEAQPSLAGIDADRGAGALQQAAVFLGLAFTPRFFVFLAFFFADAFFIRFAGFFDFAIFFFRRLAEFVRFAFGRDKRHCLGGLG